MAWALWDMVVAAVGRPEELYLALSSRIPKGTDAKREVPLRTGDARR